VVDATNQTCTLANGPSFVHCTYSGPGAYAFTIDAPGVGPAPMFTVTSIGDEAAMGFGGGFLSSDGSLQTTIFVAGGVDVPSFSVVIVSTASPGAAGSTSASSFSRQAAQPTKQIALP
jgi:hypothetical protein